MSKILHYRILEEPNVRQKVRKFSENLNCDQMLYVNQIYFNSTVVNIKLYKTAT